MNQLPGVTRGFIVLSVCSGLAWWALIKGAIWVFSHVSLGWAA
ncbi:hypothetical protein [Pseudomonas fluorescens]|nr:hypothetical protein [Pseudomonas fluorescens]